jgi:hypothetical protein
VWHLPIQSRSMIFCNLEDNRFTFFMNRVLRLLNYYGTEFHIPIARLSKEYSNINRKKWKIQKTKQILKQD